MFNKNDRIQTGKINSVDSTVLPMDTTEKEFITNKILIMAIGAIARIAVLVLMGLILGVTD